MGDSEWIPWTEWVQTYFYSKEVLETAKKWSSKAKEDIVLQLTVFTLKWKKMKTNYWDRESPNSI